MKNDPNTETSGLLIKESNPVEKTPIGESLSKRLKKRKQKEYGLSIQDDEESPTDND